MSDYLYQKPGLCDKNLCYCHLLDSGLPSLGRYFSNALESLDVVAMPNGLHCLHGLHVREWSWILC